MSTNVSVRDQINKVIELGLFQMVVI